MFEDNEINSLTPMSAIEFVKKFIFEYSDKMNKIHVMKIYENNDPEILIKKHMNLHEMLREIKESGIVSLINTGDKNIVRVMGFDKKTETMTMWVFIIKD